MHSLLHQCEYELSKQSMNNHLNIYHKYCSDVIVLSTFLLVGLCSEKLTSECRHQTEKYVGSLFNRKYTIQPNLSKLICDYFRISGWVFIALFHKEEYTFNLEKKNTENLTPFIQVMALWLSVTTASHPQDWGCQYLLHCEFVWSLLVLPVLQPWPA